MPHARGVKGPGLAWPWALPGGRSCWEPGFNPLLGSPQKWPGPSQSWGAEGNGAWEWRGNDQGNHFESHESKADLGAHKLFI